jgi:hypothetical protein
VELKELKEDNTVEEELDRLHEENESFLHKIESQRSVIAEM